MPNLSKWDELKLNEKLCEKTMTFPESSMNANKVTLVLKNKEKIKNVFLADGEWIVKIGQKQIHKKDDLPFNINEIIDVESEI